MNTSLLASTAQKVVDRTILAADESSGTIAKRFATINVTSTPETNRVYRNMLFTTPGIEKYVSGVILYDETIRQSTDDGTPFPEYLLNLGIVPGIKVDKSTVGLPGMSPDTYTQGLDGLGERLDEYRKLGAGFAKWRAMITIDDSHPSDVTIKQNTADLALYALICQVHDIVPIVEPEVLMDGSHSFEKDGEITEQVLIELFDQMKRYGVYMKGTILKPNMVTAGSEHTDQKSLAEVAQKTLDVLKKTVAKDLGGIAFLSGGQSPELATDHLNEINTMRNKNQSAYPWRITASYGRALQGESLEAWGGNDKNINKAQGVFIDRAEKVYKASRGEL